MELFTAGSDEQMKVIRRWIDESDVYMLILGGRYGSIDKETGKSYTQLEYEYALEKGKPFFSLCITETFLREKVKKDDTLDLLEKKCQSQLDQFRETVRSRMCSDVNNLLELKYHLQAALSEIVLNPTLSGWVPGAEYVNPKPLIDTAEKLKAENAQLRAELERIQGPKQVVHPRQLLGDDAVTLLLAATSGEKEGEITLYALSSSGTGQITAARKTLFSYKSRRDESRWEEAIEILLKHNLINRDTGGSAAITYYVVTGRGFRVADGIRAEQAIKKEVDTNSVS